MVGLYIGKTFEQVKNRPLYIVDDGRDDLRGQEKRTSAKETGAKL